MFLKSKSTYDWLVVGLGNPGLQYEKTRHNVGFMAADLFAESEKFDFGKNKMDAVLGECKIKDLRILVIKPQTYMNNSGKAVTKIASFYKIPTDRIIVMHDDISLPVGKIRMRRKGSDGGQRGMRDIIELLGTDNIPRIKIGVGAKPHPDYDLKDWVLGKFPDSDKENLETALKNSVLALKEIFARGIDSAMNKYNS
ncbi:MAG: aminoacyl-tRNA hydrolase [Clostridia bacterium]|nr:aminoacyl-tRNA hydrolase [Clostridia bacterium]